jgi:hypothetical protein
MLLNAWATVRATKGREKREEEAKHSMKTILKQRKNEQNEHRK